MIFVLGLYAESIVLTGAYRLLPKVKFWGSSQKWDNAFNTGKQQVVFDRSVFKSNKHQY